MTIRSATAIDADQIAHICLLTGDGGDDATGMFSDDAALSYVYATPYLQGPGGFALVWEVDGQVGGYVLGTTTTSAFQQWFSTRWWPRNSSGRAAVTPKDESLLRAASDSSRMLNAHLDKYPAHLHIDLLPDHQGSGVGRALIEAAAALLAERGIPGVHVEVDAANLGAIAFYPRVGFTILEEGDGGVIFGRAIPLAE